MIKGCQREVILLQTGESPLFESAYFVLRRGRASAPRGDMMAEAERIIGAGKGYIERRRGRMMWRSFAAGFLLGGAVFFAVALIIFFFA